MRNSFSRGRVVISTIVLIGAIMCLRGLSHGEAVSLRLPLQQFPAVVGGWRGQDQPLEPRIAQAVGVDDYLARTYADASGQPVGLYIGFYRSQRTGDTIHSPRNCLPGAGWEPVRAALLTIPTASGAPVVVNEYLLERESTHQLMLYWYQERGRVIPSEYSAKAWLVFDAVTRNRTDGALVRLITSAEDGEANAQARAMKFAQAIYPQLRNFIPN